MMRRVGIWSETVEFQTYMIAKAAQLSEYAVDIMTKPKHEGNHQGHSFYYEKLEKLERVRVLQKFEPIQLQWLYIQTSSRPITRDLVNLSRYAQHIGIFSTCGNLPYTRMLVSQLKEIVKYFPVSLKSERVFLPDILYEFDIYRAWSKRYHLGIDVHSNFLDDPLLSAKLFADDWKQSSLRKYCFNFIGNRNPESRTQIIQTVQSYLASQAQSNLNRNDYLWIEYGDNPGEIRGVPPVEYIDYLSESDFTLCPPGYMRTTHRVIEALVRGSIPVLHADELELYNLDLQDQVNCVAVRHQDWIEAIKRLLSLSQSDIEEIRCNILAMRQKYLTPQSYSRRLGMRMGLICEAESDSSNAAA
ncbi:glycosyltransferase family 47 protein [Leptolyngbya sp. DQ-M1]|uniref:exostosin domain-containing protein n=1 Tax=Leptolyngbya sp. DQ-M1 TaxID=2933920 RepID=UPI003297CC62